MNWNKKNVPAELVKNISQKYGIDLMTASIFARRGITEGRDLLYFLEDDKRFLHSPFLFSNMEDVVDRIMQAIEEEEKVLIFGDRDVDGVTSTVLLYENFLKLGMKEENLFWRVPQGEDPYGLNIQAIDEHAKNYGSLIVTVDCGISNLVEIDHAVELGIDVIVLDHHEAPEILPKAIIVDPKCKDSLYPFSGISGCAVAFKVISALRFARSEMYKNEICLLNVRPLEKAYAVECLKIENLVEKDRLIETVVPGETSFSETRLPDFLSGQQIFVWDGKTTEKLLADIFGNGVQFNFLDIREEAAKIMPSVGNLSLLRIKTMSKIAKYNEEKSTELDGFFNIFVTFVEKQLRTQYKNWEEDEESDLQLVTLAAFADIMPLKDENRIFARHAFDSWNKGKIRNGIKELFSKQNLLQKRISSSDITWNITPALNAAGRLGTANLAVELFLEKDPMKREQKASEIIALNEKRKALGTEGLQFAMETAEKSVSEHSGKLCVICDERINKGITGIIAARLSEKFNVPAIVMTETDEGKVIAGSMRSAGLLNCPDFLKNFEQFFINYGGHDAAAGFSVKKEDSTMFLQAIKSLAPKIVFAEKKDDFVIDCELPAKYLRPDVIKIVDIFEPFGNENPELHFVARSLPVFDALAVGKGIPQHLKLILDCAGVKWPAMSWGEGEKALEFKKGDKVDIIFQIQRNFFNGAETQQLLLKEMKIAR